MFVSIPFARESVSKEATELGRQKLQGIVSIPFARESVSKEVEEQYKAKSEVESFDSLRAGKCLQSTYQHHPWNRGICLFRFPSRGKVSPKQE